MVDCDKFDIGFWRRLADHSLTGIYVHDRNYVVRYVNDAVERATGYSKEELIGKSIQNIVYPEDLHRVKESVERVFSGETVRYECRYVRKSGEVRWVWGYVRPVEFCDETLALGNWLDVTRQKNLEAELKEGKELFNAFIEKSPNPAYIVQEDRFVYANEALLNLVSYSFEELSKMNPLELVHPEDRILVETRYRERLEGKRGTDTYSWRIITRDGSVYWVVGSPTRIIYNGKPAVASILVDITEIQKLSEVLRKKNEYMALVNKILRHDVLNDLTVISAAIEIDDESIRQSAMKKIERIRNLINESKVIEEAIEETKMVNLAEYAREVAQSYENLALIRYNLSPVFVRGNEALKSVIDNILRNAVTHSKANPVEISLETFIKGRYGFLKISDNGVGIPDEIKEKVFEEGFSTSGGTGIGLFIARKVLELLGGEIRVYDNVPNGAVFEIRLKRA